MRIAKFADANVPKDADGQVGRVANQFGLMAAAGELATELGVTPWRRGLATASAAWAFRQWLAGRGGVEAAEARQAVAQVRLFIEQYGDSRFDPLRKSEARPANNRAGWRNGTGPSRQWFIPPETWKSEVCVGLDPNFVAKTLSERGMLKRAKDGHQSVVKIEGTAERVYVITLRIFDGSTDNVE
jgi:putative DNA primase/helicase